MHNAIPVGVYTVFEMFKRMKIQNIDRFCIGFLVGFLFIVAMWILETI